MEKHMKNRLTIIESYIEDISKEEITYLISIPIKTINLYSLIINLHSCHREPLSIEKCIEIGNSEMDNWSEVDYLDNFIIIHPLGFGNTLFTGMGEMDIFNCLEDIQLKYRINSQKIFLIGFSMGGAGSLNIGSKYPDLFCGVCSISGYSNYTLWNGPNRTKINVAEKIETTKREASFNISNFRYTNLYIAHGNWDLGIGGGVDYLHHKSLISELKKEGVKFKNVIYSKLSHAEFPIEKRQEVVKWFNKQVKKEIPADFEFIISDLRHGNFFDITVTSLLDYSSKAIIKGTHVSGVLNLFTTNVNSISINEKKYSNFNISGLPIEPKNRNSLLFKSKGKSGPISDIIFTRILFCYDDSCNNEFSSTFQKEMANADCRFLKSLNGGISCGSFRHGPSLYNHQVIPLSGIPKETKNFTLVLYGTKHTNKIIKEVLSKSPFKITNHQIKLNLNKNLEGKLGLRFVFPNNTGGYYIINTGTDERIIAKGFGIWYGSLPDYIIYDNDKILYYGYFSPTWEFDNKLFYTV